MKKKKSNFLNNYSLSGEEDTDLINELQDQVSAKIKEIELERDKRREDLSKTNKWLLGIAIAMFTVILVQTVGTIKLVGDFYSDMMNVRERLVILESKFEYENPTD